MCVCMCLISILKLCSLKSDERAIAKTKKQQIREYLNRINTGIYSQNKIRLKPQEKSMRKRELKS